MRVSSVLSVSVEGISGEAIVPNVPIVPASAVGSPTSWIGLSQCQALILTGCWKPIEMSSMLRDWCLTPPIPILPSNRSAKKQ